MPMSRNVESFVAYMKTNAVPLDFLSWHIYANTLDPFRGAPAYYRSVLNANGFTAAESHITEWNMETGGDPAVRTGAAGAAVMTGAWITLQPPPQNLWVIFD